MTRLLPGPFVLTLACAVLMHAGPSAAQTLADGFDAGAGVGELSATSVSMDGPDLPSGLWGHHTVTTHDGIDSVKAALPARSESRLSTTVAGPALVSFWWKLVADANGDRLYFRSRNEVVSIQGNQDWQQRTFQVDTGMQPLDWLFERYSISPAGNREAWLDELVVTPIPNAPSLQAALEHAAHTIHSLDWTSQPHAGATNGSAARSGIVPPGGTSTMVLEVEGPAVVSFDWGISADEDYGSRLAFLVDNAEVDYLTGNQNLHRSSVDLPTGTHGLKFRFFRDLQQAETYTGDQTGYVDNLNVAPVPQEASLADAVERPGGVFSNSWTRQADPARVGADVATVLAPVPFTARRLYVELPSTAGLLTFWSKTETDAEQGILYVSVDDEIVVRRSGAGAWAKTELNLPARSGDRVLEAIFHRSANVDGNSPSTRVYLDAIEFTPGANNFQPDLLVGPKGRPLRGEGVHNTTAAGQTASVATTSRRPYGQYSIRCRNDSASDSDRFLLRSLGGSRDFEVLFVVTEGGRKLNYGAALKTGRFETKSLEPATLEAHEIWVVRKDGSRRRGHALRVVATSSEAPEKADAVGTKLRIGR